MRLTCIIVAGALCVAGCGGSVPAPNSEYAQAQRDLGRAQEGAAGVPDAELHIRLAQEDLSKAKVLMGDKSKENERAASLIARAQAEAELALQIGRDTHARTGLQQVQQGANAPIVPGPAGVPTSTTTTTGAQLPQNNP